MDVAVLVLLLLVQRSVLGLDAGTFTSDEGAYAAQAVALADHGEWAVDDPFLADSDDGPLTSYVNATVDDDGQVYAYAQRPAWVVVLAAAYEVGGETAMYLVPLVAAVLVPLVAWRLASLLLGSAGRGGARIAFWAAAVSPAVIVNGHVLWAHSASALVAGLAVLGVVEARRRWRAWPVALAAVASLVGVLLRAEGFLFAGALAAAIGLGALLDRRNAGRQLALAAVVGVGGVAGFLLQSEWRDRITGAPEALASRGSGSRVESVVRGGLHDLIGDVNRSGRAGVLALTIVAAAAVLLGVRARRGRADATGFGSIAVVALGAAWAVSADGTITGMVAAWPVGIAGLVALRLPDRREERLLLVAASLFAAAVLATNYAEGGGLEWGGRFLSPLIPIAAVGAAALWSMLTAPQPTPEPQPARPAAPPLALVRAIAVAGCVVIAGFATTAMRGTRDGGAVVEELVEAAGAPVALATNEFLPNIAWRTRSSTDWIVVGDDAPGRSLSAALTAMGDAGIDRFVTVGIGLDDLEAEGVEVERTDGPMVVARLAS